MKQNRHLQKDIDFHQNMIKGRVAETIVEEQFIMLNFYVHRYGMENTIPGVISHLKLDRHSPVRKTISRMPDFVIFNPIKNKINFVEVKYRADGCLYKSNIPDDYPFPDAYFVLVSPQAIKCISYSELQADGKIIPKTDNHLIDRPEFHLENNREVVEVFVKFATQFFTGVHREEIS